MILIPKEATPIFVIGTIIILMCLLEYYTLTVYDNKGLIVKMRYVERICAFISISIVMIPFIVISIALLISGFLLLSDMDYIKQIIHIIPDSAVFFISGSISSILIITGGLVLIWIIALWVWAFVRYFIKPDYYKEDNNGEQVEETDKET